MEHKFSFKRALGVILVLAMVFSSVAAFAFSANAEDAESVNVAAGKTYTTSEQFRQGGKEAGWGWDENAEIAYPDTDNKELTDGILAEGEEYRVDQWAGWNANTPSVKDGVGYNWMTIDLGEVYDLEKYVAYVGQFTDGINAPTKIEVVVSEDGETWGDVVATYESAITAEQIGVHKAELEGKATGRYVQFRVYSGTWAFLCELEVYNAVNAGGADEDESEGEPSEPVAPAEPKLFWVTHLNDNTVEGAGVIFTEAYTEAAWWIHVAFAPVADAEGVFEITAISDGIAAGTGVAQAIPEGGFVWAANTGNDYTTINPDDANAIDYTSPNCSATIADAQTWEVGMQFTFDGIDPLNPVVATSTPDVNWYDDAYVCTSTYTVYTAEENPDVSGPDVSEPEVDLEAELKEFVGEANADAKFDLVIDAPETYKAGDEITVTVTVKNITAENGLHVVNFNLYYDCEKLVLTNDLDEEDDNRLVCIDEDNLPSKWENFTKVNNDFDENNEEGTPVNADNDGVIYASALTDKDTSSTAIKEDGAVVFTFTFTANEDAEGDIGIAIPHAEVEGALNNAAGAERYAGNGGYAIIAEDTADEDTSTGEGESSTEGEESTDPVVPGDASNMIVFAIIALVAIAGSAVVIKSRK